MLLQLVTVHTLQHPENRTSSIFADKLTGDAFTNFAAHETPNEFAIKGEFVNVVLNTLQRCC